MVRRRIHHVCKVIYIRIWRRVAAVQRYLKYSPTSFNTELFEYYMYL